MAPAMTSKQRVLAAFRHQEPDRVPVDYSANEEINVALRKHFSLNEGDWEGLLRANIIQHGGRS